MNPPQTPQQEIETRLTALLLGELSGEDALAVRRALEQDAELARLHERLKRTMDLVAEAAASQGASAATPAAPHLSHERRQKLLAHFKTVAPKDFARPPRREVPWFVPMGIAAAVVAMIGSSVLLPFLARSKAAAQFAETRGRSERGQGQSDRESEPLFDQSRSSDADRRYYSRSDPNFIQTESERRLGENRAAKRYNESAPADKPAPAIPAAPPPTRLAIELPSGGQLAQTTEGWSKTWGAPQNGREIDERFRSQGAGGGGFGGGGGSGGVAFGGMSSGGAFQRGARSGAGPSPATLAPREVPPAAAPSQAGDLSARLDTSGKPLQEMALESSTRPLAAADFYEQARRSRDFDAATVPTNATLGFETRSAGILGDAPALGTLFRAKNGLVDGLDGKPPAATGWAAPGQSVANNYAFLPKDTAGARVGISTETVLGQNGATPLDRSLSRRYGLQLQPLVEESKKETADLSKDLATLHFGDRFEAAAVAESKTGAAEKRRESLERLAESTVSATPETSLRLGRQPVTVVLPEIESVTNRPDNLSQQVATYYKGAETAENLGLGVKSVTDLSDIESDDRPAAARPASVPAPLPEVATRDEAFSTFSLNVSDVSFKLTAASLGQGTMPEPATVRSEEFINAFDYRDAAPQGGAPVAFAFERARYPFAHNRDLLRFSVKTAAAGREPGRPLNLVLLLDNSGSMERADRVRIIREALRVLAAQLQAHDKLSVVAFARTARLWADGVPGNQAGQVAEQAGGLVPQGGTNLEDALNLGYQAALRHYHTNGINRIVLLTDGAANLGRVDPAALRQTVEIHRRQGIALDCFGIGWEGLNDDLLETLSRNGDGRYGFINTPEAAPAEFASQLAGALRVAAADVKAQVEFNPGRVIAYRQIGYAKHQLAKEQFRDNTVDAAEIGAAESGNALYVVEVNPRGQGPIGVVRVRYRVPGTGQYREHEWAVPYDGAAPNLEKASPALRLAAVASGFAEWLVSSPYAGEIAPDRLLGYLEGVPEIYGADPRPKQLEWMIRQARSITAK